MDILGSISLSFIVLFYNQCVYEFEEILCNCLSWLNFTLSSREFTHRVKSVSMAKFTAEEVAALQAAGNQVRCRCLDVRLLFLIHC